MKDLKYQQILHFSDYDSEGGFIWQKWEIEGNEDSAHKQGCTATILISRNISPCLSCCGVVFHEVFSKNWNLNLYATYKYTLNLDFMLKKKWRFKEES